MILIKDGRIIDPKRGIDDVLDIVIDGGKIAKIGKYQKSEEYETIIDAKGMVVAPGLVDVHVHFRDPGLTYKEDIQTGAAAAKKGGFTTVVTMANTKPAVDNVETVKYIIDSDGYKIYTPFIGCDQFPSTPCCKKCVDYVQRQMIENTIDTTIPLCIPANL